MSALYLEASKIYGDLYGAPAHYIQLHNPLPYLPLSVTTFVFYKSLYQRDWINHRFQIINSKVHSFPMAASLLSDDRVRTSNFSLRSVVSLSHCAFVSSVPLVISRRSWLVKRVCHFSTPLSAPASGRFPVGVPDRVRPVSASLSSSTPTSPSSRYLQSLSSAEYGAASVSSETLTERETSSSTSDDDIQIGPLRFRLSPRLSLCLVPILGASFVICVKLMYLMPRALAPPTFNSLRLIVSCVLFMPALLLELRAVRADWKHSRELWPGIQLGILVFCANILQILGLKYAPASRAAFLNQLSTVLVPLSAAALGMERLSSGVAAGSIAALCGIGLLTAPTTAAASSTPVLNPLLARFGDLLELASAAFSTAYVLRVGHFAQKLPESRFTSLSAVKIATQTALSFFWLAAVAGLRSTLRVVTACIATLSGGMATEAPVAATAAAVATAGSASAVGSAVAAAAWTPLAIICNALLVLWAGALASAAGAWLQTKGQSGVSAGESAVLFASQPLWASVFAVVLLRERMGLTGMIGAGLIVLGAILASTGKRNKAKKR